MDWVESRSVWGLRSEFAEVVVVVGSEEVVQVLCVLVVCRRVALHRSVLDGSVHALDLPVGPGMVGLGKPVFDSMEEAALVEVMAAASCGRPLPILRQISELDSAIGEHGVVRYGTASIRSSRKAAAARMSAF
jgi:hypothetical protein